MIKIEEGGVADCTAVLTVLQTAFAPYTENLDPPSGVLSETVETLITKCATNTLLLAKTNTNIVGCVFYTPQRDHPENLYFGRLAVLPTYQGQGIAKKLVAGVELAAQKQKYQSVILYVRKLLTLNVAFFESCGYEIYGEGTHKGFSEPTFYKLAKRIQ